MPSETAPRILLFTTPKTGNIWLKALLSSVYRIQPVDSVAPTFEPAHVESLAGGWVYHAHPYPDERLWRWANERGIKILTMFRHPGDVLVSYLHHLRNHPEEANWATELLLRDGGQVGPSVLAYVREHFAHLVMISLGWRRLGAAVVRYEELYSQPVKALATVIGAIAPIDHHELEVAVAMGEMRYLREAAAGGSEVHFRKGTVGDWRSELSPEILDELRTHRSHQTAFEAMNYSLEPGQPVEAFDYGTINPVRHVTSFENGAYFGGPMIPDLLT